MDTALMVVGSLLLAAGALTIGIVVHRIGLGRIAPTGVLGLPGRRLRADAATYAGTHRAATPLTWLTAAVAATAALGALPAGLAAGVEEWAILVVLSVVVLVVGLALATWRAHTALGDDAVVHGRPAEDSVLGERGGDDQQPDEPVGR